MKLDIIDVVAYLFNTKREEILSRCRKQHLCDARNIIAKFYRNEGLSLKKIARILNRDHSNVIYQLKVYDSLYKTDRYFRIIADKVMNLDMHYIEKCLAYGEESICEVEECESR